MGTLSAGIHLSSLPGPAPAGLSAADWAAIRAQLPAPAAVAQQGYLKASNVEANDEFGNAVAITGNTVVVGAWLEDSNGTSQGDNSASSAGAVYVFTRSGTTWSQQAYLKASNAGAGDSFGRSVAIDGDTVVVGASGEDSNGTSQADNSAGNAGAAYVFTRSGTTWSQQAYLKASNVEAGDAFGNSIGISGDTVVVGAPLEDSNSTSQGDNSASNAGAAYVYTRSGTTWSQQAYLKASNVGTNDQFGNVAIDGDTVVVGAFVEDSNGTSQGNNDASDAGAAYVFTRSGTTWSQQDYLKASNVGAGDNFGVSVAVAGDTVVTGAVGEDSNGTGGGGDNSAVSAGAAYVFAPTTGDIVIIKEATPADDTPFDFTETIPGPNSAFTLTDPADDTETFSDVPTGSYTVTEDGELGWTLDDITCVDPDNGSTDAGATATIDLDDGETVTCTFTNSRDTGTIVIIKEATPADDTPFDFTETIPGPNSAFTLTDPADDTETFSDVPTGSYTVTETGEAGWTLDDITCVDPDNGSTDAGATATIDLDDGETVTCTFSNSQDAAPTPDVFVSAVSAGVTDDAVSFGPHDILEWDDGAWSKWFNGSAAGLMPNGKNVHSIMAFWIPDPGQPDVAMTFSQNRRAVPGVPGYVDGMDIVAWDGSDFLLVFDGQDVGLQVLTEEKVDALHVLNGSQAPLAAAGGSCDDYLLISTQGAGKVPNYSGGTLKFSGEDVLGFCLTNGGDVTTGKWIMVLDGSAQGMPKHSLTGLSASANGQTLYLTTRAAFNVDSASGGHSMVYRFASGQFDGPIFRAPAEGLPARVAGLQSGDPTTP